MPPAVSVEWVAPSPSGAAPHGAVRDGIVFSGRIFLDMVRGTSVEAFENADLMAEVCGRAVVLIGLSGLHVMTAGAYDRLLSGASSVSLSRPLPLASFSLDDLATATLYAPVPLFDDPHAIEPRAESRDAGLLHHRIIFDLRPEARWALQLYLQFSDDAGFGDDVGLRLVFFDEDQILPCYLVDRSNHPRAKTALERAVRTIAEATGNARPGDGIPTNSLLAAGASFLDVVATPFVAPFTDAKL